jgi:deazaflavin-dependent oxidoreductase (nitroreductase family)
LTEGAYRCSLFLNKSTDLNEENAMTAAARYVRPGRGTELFNGIVAALTRAGVSVWGSRVLAVRGRTSGEMRTTPVNLLTVDGDRYLVAPRGVTQWVRNIRAAGEAELRVGRRVESIRVVELADDEKPAVLRAYLKRWKFEVGVFFDGVDASASDETLRQIAPGYPVFRVLAG